MTEPYVDTFHKDIEVQPTFKVGDRVYTHMGSGTVILSRRDNPKETEASSYVVSLDCKTNTSNYLGTPFAAKNVKPISAKPVNPHKQKNYYEGTEGGLVILNLRGHRKSK